jgi:LacI family transcriptional regulator
VRQPIAEMAREAVQCLVRRVRAMRAGEPAEPERVRMTFELVRRQSDAAPRIRPPARLPALKTGTAKRAHATR